MPGGLWCACLVKHLKHGAGHIYGMGRLFGGDLPVGNAFAGGKWGACLGGKNYRRAAGKAPPMGGFLFETNAFGSYSTMPINDLKAMPISPVRIMVMPRPFSPLGTLLYFSFSLMAASAIMARNQPNPEPAP